MDQKKQDLNPELKQIYDRVMNTQVGKAPEANPQNPAPTPPPPPPPPAGGPASPNLGGPAQTPPPQGGATPAPQPVIENKAFVFNGNKIVTPQGGKQPAAGTAPAKKGLPGAVIGVLVVVLVVVWGILWAKIFGLF